MNSIKYMLYAVLVVMGYNAHAMELTRNNISNAIYYDYTCAANLKMLSLFNPQEKLSAEEAQRKYEAAIAALYSEKARKSVERDIDIHVAAYAIMPTNPSAIQTSPEKKLTKVLPHKRNRVQRKNTPPARKRLVFSPKVGQ